MANKSFVSKTQCGILAMGLLVAGSVGAEELSYQIGAQVIEARHSTCGELRGALQAEGQLLVKDRLGVIEFYFDSRSCLERGLIYSKSESVLAKDGWCALGFVCDGNFGGM